MLPGILNQLGAESLTHLKKLANNVTSQYKAGEDEIPGQFPCSLQSPNPTIPELVGDFEEASKADEKAEKTEGSADKKEEETNAEID